MHDYWSMLAEGACGRALAPGEPVYYAERRLDHPTGRSRSVVVPLCAACLAGGRIIAEANPWLRRECEGCARAVWPIHALGTRSHRRHCSEACRRRARYRERSPCEPRTCVRCGAPFTARSDARWCSPACRQAAYRSRAGEGSP